MGAGTGPGSEGIRTHWQRGGSNCALRKMLHYELWLSAAGIVFLGFVMATCMSCSKKPSTRRISKHETDYYLPVQPQRTFSSRKVETHDIKETTEIQIKPATAYADLPNQSSEENYVTPLSTDYYNYNFGRSTYGNVFNANPLHTKSGYETSVYENVTSEQSDERSGSEDDYVEPNDY